jgi:AraC-like DNA-binding protein
MPPISEASPARSLTAPWAADALWQTRGGLSVLRFGADHFEAEVSAGALGEARLCRIVIDGSHVEHVRSRIDEGAEGRLKVVFQLQGESLFEQGGRTLGLSPGEWAIYDTSHPYTVSNLSKVEQLFLLAPKALLVNGALCHSGRLVRPLQARSGISKVTLDFLCSAYDQLESLQGNGADLGDMALEMIRMALLENRRGDAPVSVTEMIRDRIKAYVLRHLHEPDLKIEQIAEAMHCTKRYLHKVFSGQDETLSQFIWRVRLDRCRDDLARPDRAGEAISQIALSWGFNDSGHFSRAFRERFGVSPSAYRAGGGRDTRAA